MAESSNYPSSNPPLANPYVGPRTFTYEQRNLFFGREREARDLLARVVSERMLLFYAQSGAGKSSLLHTRLIPQLREEEGFAVLPVGRVSGELPAGVTDVTNIYLFNLMSSLDQSNEDPQRLAQLPFSHFLARLTSDDGRHWYYVSPTNSLDLELARLTGDETVLAAYDAAMETELDALGEGTDTATSSSTAAHMSTVQSEQRYVLIIDQFEEIITTHPHRRQDREFFFRQLNQALLDDPNLWVVLTLREDYVAALDPYARLMADKLRARFYMERMGIDAARAAVKQPAAQAGCPFAEGVAEALVDNLRRVKAPGHAEEQLGQYIEPVQLQVACYQLWAKVIGHNPNAATITLTDLQQSGDVNTALADFYNQALATVLASVAVSERRLRAWFDQELITEAGTRGTVYQGATETEGMPNPLVKLLIDQFLLRTEQRAGGYWVELVHDRFVDPIRRANLDWFQTRQHPLTRAAQHWRDAGSNNLLLQGEQLQSAQRQLEAEPGEFGDLERTFVQASLDAAQRQRQRRQRLLIGLGALLILILAGFATWALSSAAFAREQQTIAVNERGIAVAALTVQSEVVKTSDARLQVAEATLVQTQRRSEELANNLSIVLTAQLVPTPTPLSTPTPLLQSTPTVAADAASTATISIILPSPTPTVNRFATATFDAIQQDLAQIQVTQTSVAVTASASTVRVGSVQRVTTWVNVRNTPGYINKLSDDVVGQMAPDTPVVVIAGPTLADSITWWQIQGVTSESIAITGWIAETISGEVLLAPFAAAAFDLAKPFDGDYPITLYFGEYPEFYNQFTYDGVPLKGYNALSFGLPVGTGVIATDEGTVLRVDSEPSGFGNFILLQHEWGESLYAQLERMDVTVGERVQRRQQIGLSGNSGASTGPHLRFGIRINPYSRADGWGGFSDPLPYLNLPE